MFVKTKNPLIDPVGKLFIVNTSCDQWFTIGSHVFSSTHGWCRTYGYYDPATMKVQNFPTVIPIEKGHSGLVLGWTQDSRDPAWVFDGNTRYSTRMVAMIGGHLCERVFWGHWIAEELHSLEVLLFPDLDDS